MPIGGPRATGAATLVPRRDELAIAVERLQTEIKALKRKKTTNHNELSISDELQLNNWKQKWLVKGRA